MAHKYLLWSMVLACFWCAPISAQDDSHYESWEEAISLRERGLLDEAKAVFRSVIDEFGESEDICRRAYSQLVWTCTEDGIESSEIAVATEALARFPDLRADIVYVPGKVNELYDRLRAEMFATLNFRRPEPSRVFLDGEFVGEIPLDIIHFPVGEYDLLVTRKGFNDYTERIVVEPGETYSLEISMERRKDTKYWLTRIGGGALVATAIALAAGGSSSPSSPEMLPDAPLAPEDWTQ